MSDDVRGRTTHTVCHGTIPRFILLRFPSAFAGKIFYFKEKYMNAFKKISVTAVAAVALCAALAFAGCETNVNNGGKGDVVAIDNGFLFVATEDVMDISPTTTLKDYMEIMAENGGIVYEEASGMITLINGLAPTDGNYWFIYTTLEGYFNETWGTITYEGETIASATLGYSDLPCVEGETYAFVMSTY